MYIKQLLKCLAISLIITVHPLVQAQTPATDANVQTSIKRQPVINIQHWQTDNGVPVYFVHTAQPAMMDMEVIFRAGSAYEGEKGGLAILTGTLIDEGTPTLNADEIAQKLDDVGAILHLHVNPDMAVVGLRSLTNTNFLNPALNLFSEVLTQPTFPQEAFTRVKKQMLIGLEQEQQSPSEIAKRAFFKAMYGNQPYGNIKTGTVESVSRLSLDDVKQFYQKYYTAKNAMISLVGNLTTEQAHAISNQVSKNLPEGNRAENIPLAKPLANSVVQNIHFPSKQTTLMMGTIGITPDDPDFFPLMVGNYVLGGGMLVSRLFDVVREQHGLVYGISSNFIPMEARGPFIIFLQTRNDQYQKAIDLSHEEIKRFLEQGPTAEELIAAKKNIIGGFPLSFDSNGDIIEQLSYLAFYHLPLNFYDTYRDQMEAVTIDDIKAAFKKHVNLNNFTMVSVGEPVTASNAESKSTP